MKISSWPYYDSDEQEAALRTLKTGKVNYWTGNQVKLFEEAFSRYIGVNYSIAVSNGSLALSLAYLAIGIGKGDEIITTPRTFIATASSLVLLGAKPIFADVNHNSGCITVDTIEPLITKKTKALVVVHIAGWPADMEQIMKLAKKYNLKVVEDCSQAHGSSISEKKVGSFGDISVWSFCQDKIITTGGEGGMVSTDNIDYWKKMWSFKDHGKSYDVIMSDKFKSGFKWVHEMFGSNFRLTEFQAAIGSVQLNKLDHWINMRNINALKFTNVLKKYKSIRIPEIPFNYKIAWYKFYCFLNDNYLKEDWNRYRIINEINKEGFPASIGGCSEIYLEKCFVNSNLNPEKRLPIAKELGETSIMFQLHPTIKSNEMEEYCNIISSILEKASLN